MTDQPGSLAEALALLQTQLPHIGKDKTAKVVTREKGTYSYEYANLASILAAIKGLMGPLGLAYTSKPTSMLRGDNGEIREFVLDYRLMHAPSGEYEAGEWPLPDPLHTTPQQVGSAISYARRYSLCALLNIAPDDDDDDGQAAAVPTTRKRESPPRRPAAELPRNTDGSVSRSRTTDDELAATGQMTNAQIREHGRLERDVKGTGPQGTLRLTETPPDDPWYDPPPAVRAPRPASNVAGAIHREFARLGFTDEQRPARLRVMSTITGRDISSTNDLSAVEALEVKRLIQACKDQGVLAARLLERQQEAPSAD